MYANSIKDIHDICTGCTACVQVCPKKCIEIKPDEYGFLYPEVSSECIDCGKCRKTCPLLNPPEKIEIRKRLYGWHVDESVRLDSSSGGAFSALATAILERKGVVCGCCYDSEKRKVVHTDTEHVSLAMLRRSKYVESDMASSIENIKKYLSQGRDVLFCGTPCQIAGIRKSIADEHLYLCDFVCHGVSSMALLNEHLDGLAKKYKGKVADLNFRDKRNGWSQLSLKVLFNNGKEYFRHFYRDTYYRGDMSKCLFMKKTCYNCQFKCRHYSDITLADFWAVKKYLPAINDEKGISAIIINSVQGESLYDSASGNLITSELPVEWSEYLFHPCDYPTDMMQRRASFLKKTKEQGFEAAAKEYMTGLIIFRLKQWMKRICRKS